MLSWVERGEVLADVLAGQSTAGDKRGTGQLAATFERLDKFTKPADRPVQGIAEIIIGKQRNGPVGVAELLYMSPYTAFEDLAPDWAPSETPQ